MKLRAAGMADIEMLRRWERQPHVQVGNPGSAWDWGVVRDLMSADPADYGGNPALKMPVLRDSGGTWFGALNICRRLARLSDRKLHMVWPEDLDDSVTANAQELIVQAMAMEVV